MKELHDHIADLEDRLNQKDLDMEIQHNTMEDKIRLELSKQFGKKESLHQEEIDGLSREWDMERKVKYGQRRTA